MPEDVVEIREAIFNGNVVIIFVLAFLVFVYIGPIIGSLLHRLIRPFVPADDTFVTIASALIVFLMGFAIIMGLLLQTGLAVLLSLPLSLLLSAVAVLIGMGVSAFVLQRSFNRLPKSIDPADEPFAVWEEDRRERPKNLRRR